MEVMRNAPGGARYRRDMLVPYDGGISSPHGWTAPQRRSGRRPHPGCCTRATVTLWTVDCVGAAYTSPRQRSYLCAEVPANKSAV